MLLVTGLTGHTGKYFLKELINNNYKEEIRCIVRESSDTSILDTSGLNIEKVVGDISDEKFLNQCMQGVDTILHIVNIRYTPKILNAAIKNKVRRAICVHTTGIYSKFRVASEEYEIIEKEIQKTLTDNGNIKMTILRPTMIYGDLCDRNMSKFIKMVDKFRFFPVIDKGESLIQPVNARDLGKAYYSVLMMPKDQVKDEYILSGERPVSLVESFQLISDNLNKKTTFISFPLGFGVLLSKSLKLLSLGKVDYVERVKRMSEDRSFKHKDASLDFDFNPESFKEGIAREVNEYLKNNCR